MSHDTLVLLTVIETVLLVVILAIALTRVRQGLAGISGGLAALGGALATVESQHLRPLGRLVEEVNSRLFTINSVLPGIAGKAAFVVRKVTGG
jgi:hypothetical protein